MKSVKIKGVGSIEYRLPSIPEKLRLLSKLGMSPSNPNIPMDYEALATVMENIGDLITNVDCKVGDSKICSWEEVLGEESLTGNVVEIVSIILNPSKGTEKTKKS